MPSARVQRNAPCPCNSGRKYKRCCARKAQQPTQAEQAAEIRRIVRPETLKGRPTGRWLVFLRSEPPPAAYEELTATEEPSPAAENSVEPPADQEGPQ